MLHHNKIACIKAPFFAREIYKSHSWEWFKPGRRKETPGKSSKTQNRHIIISFVKIFQLYRRKTKRAARKCALLYIEKRQRVHSRRIMFVSGLLVFFDVSCNFQKLFENRLSQSEKMLTALSFLETCHGRRFIFF